MKRVCAKWMRIAAFVIVMGACGAVRASAPGWEFIGTQSVELTADENVSACADVHAINGCIYITVVRPVTVKVFTILGQIVSQKKLQPGTSRLRVGVRGLYIVRVDNITRRVTV
ncbi:MAG: T9SS type A sorting domain-containing protein [Bacteroidales bacterium]|nr:T9SS type A sorting domain-containing protein [Bacteroidales bacterium]